MRLMLLEFRRNTRMSRMQHHVMLHMHTKLLQASGESFRVHFQSQVRCCRDEQEGRRIAGGMQQWRSVVHRGFGAAECRRTVDGAEDEIVEVGGREMQRRV